jgi:thiamine kinase-like enzyme
MKPFTVWIMGIWLSILLPISAHEKEGDACLMSHQQLSESAIEQISKYSLPLKITPLQGGLSKAQLFLVQTEDRSYVIRLLNHKKEEERLREIACLKSASENGYGPEVYFIGEQSEFIAMEYLLTEPFYSAEGELNVEALAALLKKIHRGPLFPTAESTFNTINISLEKLKNKGLGLEIERFEEIVRTIGKAIENYPHFTPCHRDLHSGNLIYTKGQFIAVDYETAAQDDPFFDLASIANSCILTPEAELRLLSSYLERSPYRKDEAKLFLTKQLVLIFWGAGLLTIVPDDAFLIFPSLDEYERVTPKDVSEIDWNNPIHKIGHASRTFRLVLTNIHSDSFSNALHVLKDK